MRFFRDIFIASFICVVALVASPVAAQTTYRIQFPSFERASIYADVGEAFHGPTAPSAAMTWLTRDQPRARWAIEPVAGTIYYRIRQSSRPDWYLHNETKTLMVGPIQPGWWSAQWQIDPVFGTTDQWRICNRWTFECLTHGETSGVFLTKSLAGHAPSNWTIPGFKGNQVAAAAPTPKPTTTPVTRIGTGTPPVATPAGEPCGPAVICYLQIMGLYVNKRSEISDDEIVVTTTQGTDHKRYPAIMRSYVGKSVQTLISPNVENVYQSLYPYMAMNETKKGYRTWNFCSYSKLDNYVMLRVIERDAQAADGADNWAGGDDEIGTLIFTNNAERTGSYTKRLTGDGSSYALVYHVAARREDLPACGATSTIRDPDLAVFYNSPPENDGCEGAIEDALGTAETTQATIAFLITLSICEINKAVQGS